MSMENSKTKPGKPQGNGKTDFLTGGEKNSFRKNVHKKNNIKKSQYTNFRTAKKQEETIDDIRADIKRIEKEIELEIKEIMSLRLGM